MRRRASRRRAERGAGVNLDDVFLDGSFHSVILQDGGLHHRTSLNSTSLREY